MNFRIVNEQVRAYEAVLRTQLRLLEELSADERHKLGEAV